MIIAEEDGKEVTSSLADWAQGLHTA